MTLSNSTNQEPVTVDVLQQVKPGCEAKFEQMLNELIKAAEGFEGHLGVNVFRPHDHSRPEYRIIFKFDHLDHLHQWEAAPIRQRLLNRIKQFTVGPSHFQTITGLETWFTLPAQGAIVPPPRYKMMVISFLTIFPLSNLLGMLLQPILTPFSAIIRSLITSVILLSLTTYIFMPRMTKLFAPWLYPKH